MQNYKSITVMAKALRDMPQFTFKDI